MPYVFLNYFDVVSIKDGFIRLCVCGWAVSATAHPWEPGDSLQELILSSYCAMPLGRPPVIGLRQRAPVPTDASRHPQRLIHKCEVSFNLSLKLGAGRTGWSFGRTRTKCRRHWVPGLPISSLDEPWGLLTKGKELKRMAEACRCLPNA